MVKKKMNEENKTSVCCSEKSPFVAIPSALGGILLAVIALVLVFKPIDSSGVIINVAWAFVAMCFFATLFAFFAYKKK